MTHRPPALIEAVGVEKSFRPSTSLKSLLTLRLRGPEVVALEGVNLKVEAGEIVSIMGPNGAGKSTLLRILAGLIVPSRGSVSVAGLDATNGGPELARKVGYVPAEDRELMPKLALRDYLSLFAILHGYRRSAARRRAEELLAEVGLTAQAHRPLGRLSTGMRRRAALARGLLGAPTVLLFDEPTRGIDPQGALLLRAQLTAAARRGCAVVLTTHDLAEAEALSTRVALLDRGRLTPLTVAQARARLAT